MKFPKLYKITDEDGEHYFLSNSIDEAYHDYCYGEHGLDFPSATFEGIEYIETDIPVTYLPQTLEKTMIKTGGEGNGNRFWPGEFHG